MGNMNVKTTSRAAGLIVSLVTLLSLGAVPYANGSTPSNPTLAQLQADIATSASINKAPPANSVVPVMSTMLMTNAFLTVPNVTSECYGYSRAVTMTNANDCVWGQISATKSIFVFGDSNAAMWLPTLNILGQQLGYKIYFLAAHGCGPWASVPNLFGTSGLKSTPLCNTFVNDAIGLANALHPAVVLPIGLEVGSKPTNSATVAGVQASTVQTVHALAPSGAKVLFLQPFPWSSGSYPRNCLALRPTAITSCEMSPVGAASFTQWSAALGVTQAATALNVPMVPTEKLFCTATLCPILVLDSGVYHDVYLNNRHMINTYAQWISTAFIQLIKPYLPA